MGGLGACVRVILKLSGHRRTRGTCKGNIKVDLGEIQWESKEWIPVAQYRDGW